MKRELRVKKHQEFDRIVRGGKKIKSPHYSIYFEKAEPCQAYTRIGLAISKANGNAVTRVRQKRQVRAMLAKRGDYSLPLNLIIVIRPNFQERDYHENEAELLASLAKLKDLL